MDFPEKCPKLPVMSDALRQWTVEQQKLIHDTLRRTNRRPDDLVLPHGLVADAEDFQRQIGVVGPVGGMTAFGIPIRVEAELPKTPRPALIIPIGGMWEDASWEIHFDDLVTAEYTIPCPHCHSPQKNEYGWDVVVCPRVIVASNEGGYNSTGVCLDCVLDAAKKLDGEAK